MKTARRHVVWGSLLKIALVATLTILGSFGAVHGDERDAVRGYMLRVREAARKDDRPALRALAASPAYDPWLVVHALGRDGLAPQGQVYAGAIVAPDAKALLRYASALPQSPLAAWQGLKKALHLAATGQHGAAVEQLEGVAFPQPSIGAVRTSVALGGALFALDRIEDAAAAFGEAAATARQIGWLAGQDEALIGRQWRLEELSRYADMRGAIQRRRVIHQLLGSAETLAELDRELGAAHLAVGTPRRALPPLERSLNYYLRKKQPVDAAYARVHLAIAHAMRGEFAKALSLTDQATLEASTANDEEALDYASAVQMSILADVGKNDVALRLGARLLKSDLKRDPSERVALAANQALVLARAGRFDEALPMLEHCLATCAEHGLDSERSGPLMIRGMDVRFEQGRYAESLGDFTAAEAVALPSSAQAAYAAWGKGRATMMLSKRDAAEQHLRRALALAIEHEDADLQDMVHASFARLYLDMGKLDSALEHAHKAIQARFVSSAGLSDDEKIVLRSRRQRARVFEVWVRIALRFEGADELYEAIEAGRSHALLTAMGGPRAVGGTDLPATPDHRERDLRAELREKRGRYALLRTKRARNKELRALRSELRDTERKYLLLSDTLWREPWNPASLSRGRPMPLDEVTERVPEGAALVLCATLEEAAVALVITRGGARRVAIGAWAEVRTACGKLAKMAPDASESVGAIEEQERIVATHVLDGLELPATIRRVYLSPDGPLSGVPWPAITRHSRRALEMTLIPSASTFASSRGLPIKTDRRIALGDPTYEAQVGNRRVPWFARGQPLQRLRHSADEARAVAGTKGTLLLGLDASETRLKKELAGEQAWDVIHLACHGLMDADAPSLSSLALTPTAEDDGFLTAVEILRMRLRARLVTLAACDIGSGTSAAGEGMLGVVRALFAAGAGRVLVSLWPADDEATTELMKSFYEERAKTGVSDHEALRRAQLAIRERTTKDGKTRWAHPYYWAGWVFWGLKE